MWYPILGTDITWYGSGNPHDIYKCVKGRKRKRREMVATRGGSEVLYGFRGRAPLASFELHLHRVQRQLRVETTCWLFWRQVSLVGEEGPRPSTAGAASDVGIERNVKKV
jgi:hypothetical protein